MIVDVMRLIIIVVRASYPYCRACFLSCLSTAESLNRQSSEAPNISTEIIIFHGAHPGHQSPSRSAHTLKMGDASQLIDNLGDLNDFQTVCCLYDAATALCGVIIAEMASFVNCLIFV